MAKNDRHWFVLDDFKAAFSLFCGCCGIGTLGVPANFARAGPAIGTIALLVMAAINTYTSVCLTRTMLQAPKTVKTYGDLGEWCMGKTGRYLVVVAQMATCVLVPCVFLVLGGSLLESLFPGAFSQSTWIILMAITVLPVCLIPTLKEGAGAAFAGCLGTIIADVIGVAVVMYGMRGHPSVPFPDLSFKQVTGAFGNLLMALGAGFLVPPIQREHSEPSRMPAVVIATMVFTTVMLWILGWTGYSPAGCQISGNLLFTIYPDSDTGLTSLGFKPDWGMVVLAYLCMQMHITIAFAVLLNPAFYLLERMVLGMHKVQVSDIEDGVGYVNASTPLEIVTSAEPRASKLSVTSATDAEKASSDAEKPRTEETEALVAEYKGVYAIKYSLLRLAVLVVLVILSIVLKDHFSDLVDFIGSSCLTVSSILLPLTFHFKKNWNRVAVYEKIIGGTIFAVCFFLGCYVTYTSGKTLFAPTSSVNFPFCEEEYQTDVFYNYTAVHGSF